MYDSLAASNDRVDDSPQPEDGPIRVGADLPALLMKAGAKRTSDGNGFELTPSVLVRVYKTKKLEHRLKERRLMEQLPNMGRGLEFLPMRPRARRHRSGHRTTANTASGEDPPDPPGQSSHRKPRLLKDVLLDVYGEPQS